MLTNRFRILPDSRQLRWCERITFFWTSDVDDLATSFFKT
jgi:hypothetical protein